MNINEFNKLEIQDKIDYINKRLCQGDTVAKIREDIGFSEKSFQKEIKKYGYRYNQKSKQYVSTTTTTTIKDSYSVLDNTTSVVPDLNIEMLKYIGENFNILVEFLEKYKATTQTATNSTTNYITIDLVDDKHLNPKPKSVRINEFIYRDWQEFCNNKHYSKMDLISMALKEYMEKYK